MKKSFCSISLFISVLAFSQEKKSDSVARNKEIQEVVIKGRRKPVEQTRKGVILNVSGTVLEEKDNVSEILKFAPNASQIGGLKVLGSDRIQILLNGKEVKIKPEQFQTFLASLDAKSIKSIEVVDKPDASLDSRFASQIIISTKKIKGIEASLGMGSNYNFKFGQNSDASFSANLGKLNIYSSGNFFQSFAKFNGDNALEIDENSLMRNGIQYGDLKRFGYNGAINLNYDFNDKNSLSFLYDYTADEDLDKNFNYDYKIKTSIVSDSAISVRNRFESINKTHTFSLQYLYKPDEIGSMLTLNADYAIDNFNLPFQSLNYFYRNNALRNFEDIFQNTRLSYNLFTASADYQKIINEKNTYSFGAKFSNSANLNILDYFNAQNFVPENSQYFDFYENIYAGYFKYTHKPGKFSYSLGLRNELTLDNFRNNKGFSGDLSYNNLLPSALVSYSINKNNSAYLLLRKEITRPTFFSYDPTVFVLPPNEKSSGNENLKPVQTYKVQSGYTFRQKYSLILQYAYSVDNIVSIPRTTDDNYIFTKPENAGYQNQMLLNLSIPIKVAKFWQATNKFNFIYRDFKLPELNAFYKAYFATVESTQSFMLPKGITLDLNLSYKSPSQNKFTYNYSNFVSDFSATIPLFQKMANLRFGISDILNTDRIKYDSNVNGIYQYNYMKFRTRNFFLKFTYYFKSGKEMEGGIRDAEVTEMLNRTGK